MLIGGIPAASASARYGSTGMYRIRGQRYNGGLGCVPYRDRNLGMASRWERRGIGESLVLRLGLAARVNGWETILIRKDDLKSVKSVVVS